MTKEFMPYDLAIQLKELGFRYGSLVIYKWVLEKYK